jgi:hypothetical protein
MLEEVFVMPFCSFEKKGALGADVMQEIIHVQ